MKDYKLSNTIRHAPFIGIYSDPNSIVSEKKSKSKSKSKSKPISPSKTKKIRTKPVPRQRVKATAADTPSAAPVPILSPLLEMIQAVEEPRVKRVQPKPKPRARVKPVKPEPVVVPSRVVRRPFNLLEPTQRIQLKPRVRRSSVFFKANADKGSPNKANADKGSPNKENATKSNETLKKQLLIKGARVNRMPVLNHPLLRMSLKARKAAQSRPLVTIRE